MKVVSAAQMREMDRQTIDEYGVPSIVLMENAAHCVLEAMADRYGPLRRKRVAVVCGKGNNGGDGLAVARHLATRLGAAASVWLAADPAAFVGDAATNYRLAQKFGLSCALVGDDLTEMAAGLARVDLVVDALLGTGIRGAVVGALAGVIQAINESGRPVISVDVPSGLNADTGAVDGACVQADLCVTFALPKFGLLEYPGVSSVGKLVVGDIGLPRQVMAADAVRTWATDAADVVGWLPGRVENRDSNKGKFGHVVVAAGSRGFAGAPALSADAAARAGAGLVTLAVPLGLQSAAMGNVSPVVMTRGLPETPGGTFSRAALGPALELAAKGTAAALGPGLGGVEDEDTQAFVQAFAVRCTSPLVIDADALNILAREPDHGASLVSGRTAGTVLTPHPGEMARLLGTDTKTVQADRRGAVEEAVRRFGCVVLLKGSRTLIASPDGALHINTTGNAGMASGGMGDTLTGIIAALLAARLPAREAAAAGAYLHGRAGDLAVQIAGGKAGLLATDVIDSLPRALGECQKEDS